MSSARRMCGSSSTTRTRVTAASARDREPDQDGGATPRRVVDGELAAHDLHEAARHREAEADPGAVRLVAQALEGPEHGFPLVPGDPRALVGDRQLDPTVNGAREHAHGSFGR